MFCIVDVQAIVDRLYITAPYCTARVPFVPAVPTDWLELQKRVMEGNSSSNLSRSNKEQTRRKGKSLGDLVKAAGLTSESLRQTKEVQNNMSQSDIVKVPANLLQDPFKNQPPVNVEAEYQKAEQRFYESLKHLRVIPNNPSSSTSSSSNSDDDKKKRERG
uniref:Uncharacterized protein n=1 Tax=Romanomermis culicivorax TaxID=13658 RepID=A0A915KQN9_ROMCU